MKGKKAVLRILVAVAGIFVLLELCGYIVSRPKSSAWKAAAPNEGLEERSVSQLKSENSLIKKKVETLSPHGVYIVIDSGANKLYLKKGDQVMRETVVSCGSGSILEDPRGNRKWIFDTPRGEFYVKSKIKDPDWIKPDWAFIEEGKEVPKNFNERVESGMLGDYALGFGDGFFVHGTLYTRLLGRNVTHGCVRVGDADLKIVFQTAQIGTKIFIY